jgi:hypothetical protein
MDATSVTKAKAARADRPAGRIESQRQARDDLVSRCVSVTCGVTRLPVPTTSRKTEPGWAGCDNCWKVCPWSQAQKPWAGLEDSGDEPEAGGIAGFRCLGSIMNGSSNTNPGYGTTPVRTVTAGKVWAVRRVRLPLLALALRSSFRVPRFSRLVLADSVRFVRFNMA